MSSAMAWMRRRAFGINLELALRPLSRLPASCRERGRLEAVVETFMSGYHAALEQRDGPRLARRLTDVEAAARGFAFEGAAMALRLVDAFVPPSRRRLASFLAGPGAPHAYMVLVGAGWALARLRRPLERQLVRFDPLLRWLVSDGYGFHQGFFREGAAPAGLDGYARRAFDQGLGRSVWFTAGAAPEAVRERVDGDPAHRRPDLWSGVGLACAYAGGTDAGETEALLDAAGEHAAHFAQGVAFAAAARDRAGNPAPHSEDACRRVWGRSGADVAAIAGEAARNLPPDGQEPAYEEWRRRVRARFCQDVGRVASP